MKLISQSVSKWEGKTVRNVLAGADSIHMTNCVIINFTDGEQLILALDWRGQEAYISEYLDDKRPAPVFKELDIHALVESQ